MRDKMITMPCIDMDTIENDMNEIFEDLALAISSERLYTQEALIIHATNSLMWMDKYNPALAAEYLIKFEAVCEMAK